MAANTLIGWSFFFWLTGLILTLLLIPVVRSWAIQRGHMDRAGQIHTNHVISVPRLGGIAITISFITIFLLLLVSSFEIPREGFLILFTSLAMFGLGLWDDLKPLGAKVKLTAQILIAAGVYVGGLSIQKWMNPFTEEIHSLGMLDAPLTILWIVGVTNLINLIDGVDGLAAGLTLLLMILLSILSGWAGHTFSMLLTIGMVGTLLGFLFYNFPPAKIFMGDGGAYFLGALIAELSLFNSNKGAVAAALIAPFFALGLPIIDAVFTILRRGLTGLPIFRADRRHIHHRLAAMGLSQQRIVLLLYAFCAFFALLALSIFISRGRLLPVFVGIFMIVMILSARFFGYVKDWYKFGRLLTNSIVRRKHVKYAVLLGKLLFLEAERCKNLDELWKQYGLLLQKLSFSRAALRINKKEQKWEHGNKSDLETKSIIQKRGSPAMEFTFHCKLDQWDEDTFQLLSELAAESWVKAHDHWHELHNTSA